MEPRYRTYLTEPEEKLLLAQNPLLSTTRLMTFMEDSHLPLSRIVTSPMMSVPVPLYVDKTTMPNGRQFPSDTNPALFWHPLFWLPESLANKLSYRDRENPDVVHVESDDQWAARVALTLSASGVYDPENGKWLDMLSVVGLDSEDEMVLDRIVEWLDGSSDPDLDSIDLSALTDIPDQPHWAFRSVQAIFPELVQASYAFLTHGTIDLIDIIVRENSDVETLTDEFADAVEALTLVMEGLEYDIDGEDFYAVSADVVQTAREYRGDRDTFVEGTVAYYRAVLETIRSDFWGVVVSLNEEGDSSTS